MYHNLYLINSIIVPVSLMGVLIAINTIMLFCHLLPQFLYMISKQICYFRGKVVTSTIRLKFYINDKQLDHDNEVIMKVNDWYFRDMDLWSIREITVLFTLFLFCNCVVIGINYVHALIGVCVLGSGYFHPGTWLLPFAFILTSLIISNSWGYAMLSVSLFTWYILTRTSIKTRKDIFIQEIIIQICKLLFVIVSSWLYFILL